MINIAENPFIFWMTLDELPGVEILGQIIQKIRNALRIFFLVLGIDCIALFGGRKLSIVTGSDF